MRFVRRGLIAVAVILTLACVPTVAARSSTLAGDVHRYTPATLAVGAIPATPAHLALKPGDDPSRTGGRALRLVLLMVAALVALAAAAAHWAEAGGQDVNGEPPARRGAAWVRGPPHHLI